MSLDIYLEEMKLSEVYSANITHNLNTMADAAGIYKHLWHPEDVGVKTASDLIEPLEKAIQEMRDNPEKFKRFDARNGWGTYDDFVPWLERLLCECKIHPNASITVSI